MPRFANPFRKRDASTFPGVLIPLQRVRRPVHPPVSTEAENGADGDADDVDGREQTNADGLVVGSEDEALLLPSGPDGDAGFAVEDLKAELEKEVCASESAYDRKSRIINKAIQNIGMGRYQWELFALCGMGWLADNLWMQALALVLPQLTTEFGVSTTTVRYTTMITFIGLSVGSTCWGVASDIIGRRPAFNTTLLICGAFGTAVAFASSWPMTALFFACMGTGVGGNLPVDGALFLEFLPFESNKLLTLLSVWWPIGQLLASLIAWVFIPPFSCGPELQPCSMTGGVEPCCLSEKNRGWRYFIGTMGVLTLFMFFCRFFLFHLFESPKFLLSRGRQAEAVHVVHGIAYHNRSKTWLTDDLLEELGGGPDSGPKISVAELQKRNLSKFSVNKVEQLFIDKTLGLTTLLLWIMWFTIGMGFPLFNAFLPQYLEHAGEGTEPVSPDIVYRNFAITSIVGVPGSVLACYTVDLKYIGRKGSMAVSTLISGILLYLFTLDSSPGWQTLCSSLGAFFQNIMYGVLYAYTPEVFPAPVRGTGTGIASLLNRIAGIAAPVVAATVGSAHPTGPIIGAGVMYLVAFVAMCFLPIETRGKQSL